MRHVYIKARTPQLNGKVERSHRTDEDEFYQLLSYTDDVDLNEKVKSWEHFYNFNRPHAAFEGKTPDEALSEKASKRIKTAKSNNSSTKRSNVITDRQKSKLADRLNDVMRQSLTIWSSKTGLYISYQGKNSFLVKKFSPTNRVLSQNFLTKEELLSGDIPEIFTTTWKKM